MPKLEKEIVLDLTGIPVNKRKEAKEDVAEFILTEAFNLIAQGKSPVKGVRKFKSLSKEYADNEKQGRRVANLELEGDLLEAFDVVNSKLGVRMQIADGQHEKAQGHNQLDQRSKTWAKNTKFPRRQFFPDKKEDLKPKIMDGVENILEGFRQEAVEFQEPVLTTPGGLVITPGVITSDRVTITIEDLFSDESIIDALLKELR